VEARRAAAEHVVALLARIPEATTRELYVQRAARRLDLGTQSLTADLNKVLRDGAKRTPRVVFAPPASVPPGTESAATQEDAASPAPDVPMPQWEAYLARMVVHRPALARALTQTMGLDVAQLTHPTVRRLIEVALQTDNGVFPVHRLGPDDQRHAARLMVDDVPELDESSDPSSLTRVMADCVRLVHEESVRRSLATIQHELRRAKEEGRFDEVERLAAQLSALAAEAPHLRSTLSTR
jgi:DNA primase